MELSDQVHNASIEEAKEVEKDLRNIVLYNKFDYGNTKEFGYILSSYYCQRDDIYYFNILGSNGEIRALRRDQILFMKDNPIRVMLTKLEQSFSRNFDRLKLI